MSASSTLSFNVSKQCFTIVIIDDTAAELEEHLTLFISLPHKLHNVFITQQTATVQIVDNDGESLFYYIQQLFYCIVSHTSTMLHVLCIIYYNYNYIHTVQ